MDQQTIFVLAVAALALVAGIIVMARQRVVRRREALAGAALGMGLEFTPGKVAPPGDIAGMRILSHGRAHTLRNVMSGQRADTEVLLADHHYVTGSGRNSSRHRTALAILRRRGLALPRFYLRPQVAVIDRIGKLLGGKDLDLPEDPDFSRAFVLQGEDENALRALFGPAARHQALQLGRGVKAEGRGETLLVERSRRVAAPEAALFLDTAAALMDVLASGHGSGW